MVLVPPIPAPPVVPPMAPQMPPPPPQDGVSLPAGGGLFPDPAQIAPDVTVTPEGGVIIGTPPVKRDRSAPLNFDENLAEKLSAGAKATIVEEILQGIDADEMSRKGFIDNYVKGIDLLGLKIESESNTRSQKRNVSRVRHPILLEACVRGQSAARAELLPSSGPCKIVTIGGGDSSTDELASAFESDFNNYLVNIAREYYPDMDRGLFELFFNGNLFKKIYTHPVRRRPVSECVNVSDLIVSEDARDLDTAVRVTHRTMVAPPMVKRMQVSEAWVDVDLGNALPTTDPATRKEREAMGVSIGGMMRPQDQERCIYETMYDLDLGEWDMAEEGQPKGLPIPYLITIDKDSRQMLAMRRNWKEADDQFIRKQRYVHYCLVPALGFLGVGYLHLLGNQTKALTAMWRIITDSGMFACFPGGVKAKGVRTSTNEIQPGPGEWVDIDVGPFDRLQDALMPLPYKDPSPVFIQFSELVGQDAQRLAGSIEMEVGEGRTNIPVGTIMSMIEQQTQVMSAVHKRLHDAQKQELQLLREEFVANPEALWKLARNPARKWEVAAEFMNLNLVPASDPNVPSQTHRIMLATALVTLASTNPDIYDKLAVHKNALRTVGIKDNEAYLHAPVPMPDPNAPPQKPPDPFGAQKMMIMAQEQQRKAADMQIEASQRQQEMQLRAQTELAATQSRERTETLRQQTERMRLSAETMRDHRSHQLDVARLHGEQEFKTGGLVRQHDRDDLKTIADIAAQHRSHDLAERTHGLSERSHDLDQRSHALEQDKVDHQVTLDQKAHDLEQQRFDFEKTRPVPEKSGGTAKKKT